MVMTWGVVHEIEFTTLFRNDTPGPVVSKHPSGMPRYAIPCNAPGVLQIMCHSDEVKMIPIDLAPWPPEVFAHPEVQPKSGSHGSFVLHWVGPSS